MYAVIGATGHTGIGVVKGLLAAGKPTRAIVRNTARAQEMLPSGVEIIEADLLDVASLQRALGGVSYLYSGLGGAPNLVELEKAVIDAAKAVGVTLYVKCSGVKVSLEGPSKIQKIHAELEAYASANVPSTIIAPSFFMENFLGLAGAIQQGVLPLPTGDAKAGLVAVDDISRSAVAVLGDVSHVGKRYQITGPESLSHGDAARVFTKVFGRAVQFVNVPEAAFAASCEGAGMPGWFAALLADVYAKFYGSGDADIVTDDVRHLTGTAPRAFESWLRDHAAAFATS